jgi:hypothetical protein
MASLWTIGYDLCSIEVDAVLCFCGVVGYLSSPVLQSGSSGVIEMLVDFLS